MINNFNGNDLEHYAGVAKENNLLNDWSRHFLYNIGSLLYHKEKGKVINFSFKQETRLEIILSELASEYPLVKSCCLSSGKTLCSRCIKLKKLANEQYQSPTERSLLSTGRYIR